MMITLNKRLYSRSCVVEGVRAFQAICPAEMSEGADAFVVSFAVRDGIDRRALEGEFLNYCVGWMRQDGA